MIVRMTIELEGENDTRQLEALLRGLVNAISVEGAPQSAVAVGEDTAAKKQRKKRTPGRPRAKRGEGATSMIKMLINEGYFAERHTAAQVRDDLNARGYGIDNRQIYVTLKYFADRNQLSREKAGGSFVYFVE
ncbi:MAG: hypothetical protein IAE89_10195 [Anaerolineae bacterium]|nr:hypothetical protein [Anaerolineae bacterium]